MPRPAKRIRYTVLWNDGTFLSYDLTDTDYKNLASAMVEGKNAVQLSIGVLKCTDIRSIVEYKEPEPEEETKPANPDNELDMMSLEYLQEVWRTSNRGEAI